MNQSPSDLSSPHPVLPVRAKDHVLIWHAGGEQRPAIIRALAQSGSAARWLSDAELNAAVPSAGCDVVIAVLHGGTAVDPRISQSISTLSQRGFSVIACMEHAAAMSLASRCQLHLIGCRSLIDTAQADFPLELQRTLTGSAPARDADEYRIRSAMAEVGAVGESAALLSVFRRVARISSLSDLPTLVTGESGTGKELLVRALYSQDPKRRAGPFVALNCSAISPMLAESELFGHKRGAFTGADRDRKGLIRAADGGVLFLDEIGELSGPLQAKLLRVLQEDRVLAVGDDREVAVSVRVIAATNADLRAMVETGTFRADLFHRVNVLSLHLPPLRERRSDIPPLVEHFVHRHASLSPASPVTWEAEFVDALCELDLPGNARQLENLVRWALVQNSGGRLGLGDLPPEVWEQLAHRASPSEAAAPPASAVLAGPADAVGLLDTNGWSLSQSLDSCERSIIATALRVSHGNQSRAARLLGITPRSVYNKVRRHKLA